MSAMVEDQRRAGEQQAAERADAKPDKPAKDDGVGPEAPQGRLTRPGAHVAPASDSDFERELAGSSGVFSQEGQYEGQRISSVSIRYVSGKRVLPDSRLYDVIQTRSGSKYSGVVVNEDLQRLIERGLVDGDARVAVEPTGSGLRVVFEVRPAGVMAGVGFTGNTFFTESKLRGELKLKSSSSISDRALADARAQIIKMYQEANFPDVQVSWRYSGTAREGYRDVIFDIKEGRRVTMDNIEFVGNRRFDAAQLRQVMQTKERGLFTWLTKSGRIDRERVQDDLQEVVRLYRNYGYLRASIAKVEYFDSGNPKGTQRLTMRIHVNEGPQYKVRNVSFRGITVYTPQQLHPGLSMLGGDIYSLQKVSDDSRMIRNYYGAKGYADAAVRPDIDEVGVDANGVRLVDICYDVTEGSRYNVGRINVTGNTKTRSHVILRELPIKPGQPLNSVDIETAKKRLKNLNYFHDPVEITQSASGAAGYRDINVNVREKDTGSLNLGLAFSSIENIYLYASVTQSNFDIRGLTNGTFVGGGQRLTLSGRLGADTQSAMLSFVEPWFLDQKLAFGIDLYYSNSSYMSDYYTQENLGVAFTLRKALTDEHNIKLEYRLEQYTIDPESGAPLFFQLAGGDFTRSNIRLAYEYDTRDAMVTPRKGGHFELYGSWSGPGSTVETYSVGFNGSYYYNAAWDSIWSVNFGVQTVEAANEEEMVPVFERCYLGGPNNLRGFRYHDVGMVDPALAGDETMGGNSSAYAQFEVTVPLMDSLRFAAFTDVGFVNAESFDFSSSCLSADYGIGLRLNLPMGPIAVDYAIPFKTGNAVDRGGQFQFYVNYKY